MDGGADADGAVPVAPRGEGRECFIVKDRMGLMGDLSGIGGWERRRQHEHQLGTLQKALADVIRVKRRDNPNLFSTEPTGKSSDSPAAIRASQKR